MDGTTLLRLFRRAAGRCALLRRLRASRGHFPGGVAGPRQLHSGAPRREDPGVAPARSRASANTSPCSSPTWSAPWNSPSTLDPEDWRRLMERYFADPLRRRPPVRGHGRQVHRRRRHGALRRSDRPRGSRPRACYAALHLREALARYSDELRRSEGSPSPCAWGSTPARSSSARSPTTSGWSTRPGHTVGLATRVEALAEPARSTSPPRTASLVTGYVDLGDLGFRCQGRRANRSTSGTPGRGRCAPARVAAARGPPRSSATTPRWQRWNRHWSGRSGRGGSSGWWPSRAWAKAGSPTSSGALPGRGLSVWKASALAHAHSVPFLMALELLRDAFAIAEGDDGETARQKVISRLLDLDSAFETDLPLLLEFLGVPDRARPVEPMDPEARRRQLFATATRFVRARTERATCVVLVEDLHWLDRRQCGLPGEPHRGRGGEPHPAHGQLPPGVQGELVGDGALPRDRPGTARSGSHSATPRGAVGE